MVKIQMKGVITMKGLYIQTDNPLYPYIFWCKNTMIACCSEEDYENTVNELADQGYTFINRV